MGDAVGTVVFILAACAAMFFLGYTCPYGRDGGDGLAGSMVRAEWAQVYWLQKAAERSCVCR